MIEPPFTLPENLRSPNEQLPKIGQRVRVVCMKEMTYMGNSQDMSSEWMDDGQGHRAVMFWDEIKVDNEKT